MVRRTRKAVKMAFDEINAFSGYLYGRPLSEIYEGVAGMLEDAYIDGADTAASYLGTVAEPDPVLMGDSIYRVIAGKTVIGRITDHIEDEDEAGLRMLMESEYHRVFNEAALDAARAAEKDGPGITKTSRTMPDDRVRDTHSYSDGMTIPLADEFYTYDGDHAARAAEKDGPGITKTSRTMPDDRVHNTHSYSDGMTIPLADEFYTYDGPGITKTYRTMLDDRVRDTHSYLEGMTIPLADEFYTYDGDHAAAPGGFTRAENNVNCRCFLSFGWVDG